MRNYRMNGEECAARRPPDGSRRIIDGVTHSRAASNRMPLACRTGIPLQARALHMDPMDDSLHRQWARWTVLDAGAGGVFPA